MGKVLMVHHLDPSICQIILNHQDEFEEITFDDGLFSQFYYMPLLKDLRTHKTLFIAPGMLYDARLRRKQYPTCTNNMDEVEIHEKEALISKIRRVYMTPSEISDLVTDFGCEFGGHSYKHEFIRVSSKKLSLYNLSSDAATLDTAGLTRWMKSHRYDVYKFCFPFNQTSERYETILRFFGFQKFYGMDRVDVYDLM